MNILSLFDGMSCGQIALERAGIHVNNYFASEIDKWSISVTQRHYPNTVQLGNVLEWKTWKLPNIDLLIGGSPCQGFSNAGKGLNFEDPRSKLFFVYVDILRHLKSKNSKLNFLLENVRMKKEWQDIITKELEVEPRIIDSALVSAQSRKRIYWTNWKFSEPEDKYIYLKDIVEDGEVDRAKDFALDANYHKGSNYHNYFEKSRRQIVFQGAAIRNQITKRGVEEQLNVRKDEKSNCIVPSYPNKLNGCIQVGMASNIRGKDQWRRIYSISGKSPTVVGSGGGHHEPKIALDKRRYRKLTPLECERLQTVPERYTENVSNTQRYKMLGNGWTVDVIAHIFKQMPTVQKLDTS